jgi:hypothetical protein
MNFSKNYWSILLKFETFRWITDSIESCSKPINNQILFFIKSDKIVMMSDAFIFKNYIKVLGHFQHA